MYKLAIDPLAKIDIEDSIRWYNRASQGLGNQFYKKVKSTFFLIQNKPLHFPIRYKTTRTALVEKFPFLIHYNIDESNETIAVLGVLHTSRNSEIWEERTE